MATVIKINEQNNELALSDIDITMDEQEKGWIAYCAGLKVIGYSNESKQDALEDLKHALEGFFKIHLAEKTLKKALLEFGWTSKIVEETNGSKENSSKPQLFNIFVYS